MIRATMRHRVSRDSNGGACWSQDQIDWAIAGAAKEAAEGLVRRFRIASRMCRFPIYGRGTVVSGSITDGKLTDWSITPESRRSEVVIHEPQTW